MFATKTISKIKTILSTVIFAFVLAQAIKGWILLIKDGIDALNEARARRQK